MKRAIQLTNQSHFLQDTFQIDDTIQYVLQNFHKERAVSLETISQFSLYACRVEAGFPSPADDFVESSLDLNNHLIDHPAATFFVRVNGDSMIGVGIHHNDILIVDRSLTPKQGSVVIAVINGELTVKTLDYKNNMPFLQPANPNYPIITITSEMDFSIWGVVTSVIHKFK